MRISIKLSQAALRREALLADGRSPKAYGQRKASQPHRNRLAEARRGLVKHKAQMPA